ncbi:MAG: hypothetical protein MZU79_06030 [Anaerotruncus sp.]|nr:hypothetical protein [Anaerotruncus sp.]
MGPALKPENIKRNLFNDHIRTKYGAAIWDLADAEASTAEGTDLSSRRRGETRFSAERGPTPMDGGHLNEVGSEVIAIDSAPAPLCRSIETEREASSRLDRRFPRYDILRPAGRNRSDLSGLRRGRKYGLFRRKTSR